LTDLLAKLGKLTKFQQPNPQTTRARTELFPVKTSISFNVLNARFRALDDSFETARPFPCSQILWPQDNYFIEHDPDLIGQFSLARG